MYIQLAELLQGTNNFISKLSTIVAVLHNKNKDYFWTGFYFLTKDNNLEVSCYQGPLACIRLKKDTGVCWAALIQEKVLL
ncbi:MAG: hypothetical protein M0Q45_05495 [Bacteroidales bacterium]|nr:hypothetical protein [Bacteroidales bacterium]MCK9498942.1 hypothetical protein [Bacteroidales bacterium]